MLQVVLNPVCSWLRTKRSVIKKLKMCEKVIGNIQLVTTLSRGSM